VRHSHALRLIWLASFVAAFSPTVRPDRLAAGAAARRRLRVSQNRLAWTWTCAHRGRRAAQKART